MSVEQQAGLLLVCMQVQQFQIAADSARLVLQRRRRRGAQRRRILWVRPWLEAARRFQQGHYHRLMPELHVRSEDPCSYFNYLLKANVQMSETLFLFCLQAVRAVLERRGSAVRTPWKRGANAKSAAQTQ